MSENKVMPAVSGEARYRTAQEETPPLGVKLLVYTSGGVTVVSDWRDDSNFIAWAPLPKKPEFDASKQIKGSPKLDSNSEPMYTLRPEGVRITKEPVAWRIAGRYGWAYQDEPPYESQRGRVTEPLYTTHPDHHEVLQQALDWLTDEQSVEDEDCGEAACGHCVVVRQRQVIIDALKRALGERDE